MSKLILGARVGVLVGFLGAFPPTTLWAQQSESVEDTENLENTDSSTAAVVNTAPAITLAPGTVPPADFGVFDRDIVFQAHKLRGLRAEVASLLISKDSGGPIALAVLAAPAFVEEEETEVALLVEVDGNSFLQNNQREIARVEIYAYVLAATTGSSDSGMGSVVDFKAEAIQVDVGKHGEAIWQSGLKFYGQLALQPGSYTIRVMVRNYHSKAYGVRSVEIEVPDDTSASVANLTALFEEPTQRDLWLPIRQWSAPGEQSPAFPFAVRGSTLSPAAYPVMVASSEEKAFLFGADDSSAPTQGEIQIFASKDSDEIVGRSELVVQVEEAQTSTGAQAVQARFTVPNLPTAEYAARFALTQSDGRTAHSKPQTVFILEENPQSRKLLWPDLRWLARGAGALDDQSRGERPKTAEATKKSSSKRRMRKLKENYRQALAQLISGSEMEGRSAVFELESEAMRQGLGAALEDLRRAEIEVAQELASKSGESLVPIMVLHGGLYQAYRGRRLYALLSHTRTVIEQISEVYLQAGGSRSLVAESLASLGGYLQKASLFSSSQRLFLKALEYEPANMTALLGMAAGLERHAQYAEAISYLTRLVQVQESSAEGALRLAINFARSGVTTEANRLFLQASSSSASPWVRCLAYQEMARVQLTVGDLSKAAELLEEAIAAVPEEQSTYLLLAHVYDRLKEPRRSIQLLNELKAQPGSRATAARKIYDSWPEAPMERARRKLSQEAKSRLSDLQQVLGGQGS